ncbi:MAG: hypothetical protein QM760_11290 [Nibricoccus sp.]
MNISHARGMSAFLRGARWLTSITFFLIVQSSVLAAALRSEYRGFSIDKSQVQKVPDLDAVEKAVCQQIDMVCSVGLSEDTLTFLQNVPLILIPPDAIPRSSPGLYGRNERSVKITSRITSIGKRPVLLHELLHAYHHQKLPDGFQNPAVISFFKKAQSEALYGARSHMMQNHSEFFACAATTYLYGATAQEPFTREALKKKQPDLFSFLKKLFGETAGNYEEPKGAMEESLKEQPVGDEKTQSSSP